MSGGILVGADAIAKALTEAHATSVTKQQSTPTYEPVYRSETDWSGLKIVLLVGVMILLSVFWCSPRFDT